MKKKIDVTNLIKIAGWLLAGAGAVISSWASDKQIREQNEENFKNYISEKSNKEES